MVGAGAAFIGVELSEGFIGSQAVAVGYGTGLGALAGMAVASLIRWASD